MENIEILKKTYDDFEKRQGEDYDGVPVESIGMILGVVGIRPDKRDLEDAVRELADLDVAEVREAIISKISLHWDIVPTSPDPPLAVLGTSLTDFHHRCTVLDQVVIY